MRIIICDDELYWRQLLNKDVLQWAGEKGRHLEIEMASNGNEVLRLISSDKPIDVIFLDINLNTEADGLWVSQRIREIDPSVAIIFVSSHSDRASEGYEVDAIGFLVKNYPYEKLCKYLDKAVSRGNLRKPQMLMIESEGTIMHVPQNDICYVESRNHDIILHMQDREIKARKTLSEISNDLGNEEFVQIHRSFIANIQHVISFSKRTSILEVRKGSEIVSLSVGRSYAEKLQEAYTKSVEEGMLS